LLDDSSIIQAMSEYPKLIERPIVVSGSRAVIGRPPENVNVLL
jgi:arsenate reductase